jgi:D-glycero-alpha-D-manno-heptose-7-phosphate kinase
MFVVTATPHRISFFGGGTDLPDFYSKTHGAVLSVTINQFVYVTVKRHGELFGEPYRLNYSETERVDELDAIRNQIARETLRTLGINPPIYISTVADMPSGSGLGSSSSFAVGLAQALNAMNQRRMHPAELAELASHIEIDVLKKPIGKQDQYNAAIGGLNHFCFYPNGGVAVRAVRMPFDSIQNLFGHLMLMWTGLTRSADLVLSEQRSNIDQRFAELTAMRDAADHAVQLFESPSFAIEEFGCLLDEAWTLKRRLATSISTPMIDDAYACARKHGAYGGKLCGAGAGGFLLLCVPPEKRAAIRRALPAFTELNIGYEPHGARVLFPQTHAGSTQSVPDDVSRARDRRLGAVV